MKFKVLAIAALATLGFGAAQASEYVCKVYCNSGSTTVVIQASSSSDAAKKIDPTPVANKICQDAGKGNASSSTMGSNQCSQK